MGLPSLCGVGYGHHSFPDPQWMAAAPPHAVPVTGSAGDTGFLGQASCQLPAATTT